MNNPPLILASSSTRRKELLSSLGVKYSIMIPVIDEVELPFETPKDCVRRLSREKAQYIAKQVDFHPVVILSADTVIAMPLIDNPTCSKILNKPIDVEHAREVLTSLRENSHHVITGVTLIVKGDFPQQITTAVTTEVFMRNYSDKEIDDFINTGGPFDKAGGYAIQDKVFKPVDHIVGSYSNVVGLPIETVIELLEEINYPVTRKLTSPDQGEY